MLVDNLAGIDPVFHEDLLHICMLINARRSGASFLDFGPVLTLCLDV